jgi:hypothetical protein
MKRKGCVISIIGTVAIAIMLTFAVIRVLTPRNLANEDPREVFESFVCTPIPQSVRGIAARGVIAFAGGNAIIDFQIDPKDRQDLIQRGRFRVTDDKASHMDSWTFQPDKTTGRVLRYVRDNQGMTETALIVDEESGRASFREVYY